MGSIDRSGIFLGRSREEKVKSCALNPMRGNTGFNQNARMSSKSHRQIPYGPAGPRRRFKVQGSRPTGYCPSALKISRRRLDSVKNVGACGGRSGGRFPQKIRTCRGSPAGPIRNDNWNLNGYGSYPLSAQRANPSR